MNKIISILATILMITLINACQSEKEQLAKDIRSGETKLFNDSAKSLNLATANEVFTKYIQYADKYKDDTASAIYLFKAADLSNGLRRPKESIALYERLRQTYPDYRKTAAALFMEAFIFETSLSDKESAKAKYKAKYKEFIDKYPNHQLTPSAQASLDQLNANLTDEQLIRKFEEQQKNNQ
jgi:outer membrane protein assembly factor BamD (BamD/ComL family)